VTLLNLGKTTRSGALRRSLKVHCPSLPVLISGIVKGQKLNSTRAALLNGMRYGRMELSSSLP
jgi:hypothetical protein